jgi:hypothetical protein
VKAEGHSLCPRKEPIREKVPPQGEIGHVPPKFVCKLAKMVCINNVNIEIDIECESKGSVGNSIHGKE